MIVRVTCSEPPEITEEEKRMLEGLKDRSIVFDEDCPEIMSD